MNERIASRAETPVLVLAEGQDDVGFIQGLCKFGRVDGVAVRSYDGKPKLRGMLQTIRSSLPEPVRVLVVLRDADESAVDAARSISNALVTFGFAAPTTHGTFADGEPAVGLWVVPDGQREGCLDTLCWDALQGHPERPCVEQFLSCVSLAGNRSIEEPMKAPIRAWLATRGGAETRIGNAAAIGSLPLEATAFRPLLEFLREARRRAG